MTSRSAYPAPLRRRFAAILYDLVAVTALLFFASMGVVAVLGGVAIESGNPFYRLFLFAVAFGYFSISWIKGGQTLGMRAWKLHLINMRANTPITLGQASIRYCGAVLAWLPIGLGFFWALKNYDKLAWHDQWSASRLVRFQS